MADDSKSFETWQRLLLGIACLMTLFLNLGEAHLWDRDEPRNAGCAAEMLAAGNWIVPIFNDELRRQKPVLLYWLIMSAYGVFGVNEFAARFWSALLGCGTVFLTASIGCHIRDRFTGLLSGLILASSLMFCVAARAATPDSVLIFCVTAALWFYVRDVMPGDGSDGCWFPQSWTNIVGVYAMLGLAVLAKGPIGFLLPMMVMGLFMLIQRRGPSTQTPVNLVSRMKYIFAWFSPLHFLRTLWAMRIAWGCGIVALVAAPWFVAVGIQTDGEFIRQFFLTENFARATSVMENHSGGWWFYPLSICVGFFPWSVLFGPVAYALLYSDVEDRQHAGIRLMLIWVGLQIAVFSLAATKLPSYVTPCYPALAVLTALGIQHFDSESISQSWLRGWLFAAMCILMMVGVTVFAVMQQRLPEHLPKLLEESPWLPAIGSITAVGGVIGSIFVWRWNPEWLVRTMVVTSVAFCTCLFGLGTIAVDRHQELDKITNLIRQQPARPVASWRGLEPSWVFYSGRPVYELGTHAGEQGEDERHPLYQITGDWRPNPAPVIEQFVRQRPDALIISTDDHIDELKNRLPAEFQVLQTADQFLKPRRLVLWGAKAE